MAAFLVSIVPSAGALLLFWLALRAIFQADRRERAAIARYEAEHPPAALASLTGGAGPDGAGSAAARRDLGAPDGGPQDARDEAPGVAGAGAGAPQRDQ